jgi:hypothetical protein
LESSGFTSANHSLYEWQLGHWLRQELPLETVEKRAAVLQGICHACEGGDTGSEALQERAVLLNLVADEWLVSCRPILKHRERATLGRLAQESRNSWLLFLLGVLGNDERRREEALRRMSDKEFRQALLKASGLIPLNRFVHPRHLESLLEVARLEQSGEEELTRTIELVAQIDGGAHLGAFVHQIRRVTLDGLRNLSRAIKHLSRVDLGFRQGIRERIRQTRESRRAEACAALSWKNHLESTMEDSHD